MTTNHTPTHDKPVSAEALTARVAELEALLRELSELRQDMPETVVAYVRNTAREHEHEPHANAVDEASS